MVIINENEVIENKKSIVIKMLGIGLLSLIAFYVIRIPLWCYSCLLAIFFGIMYAHYKTGKNVEKYFQLVTYMAANTVGFFVANWLASKQFTNIYEAIFCVALYGGALYILYMYLKYMKSFQRLALQK